MASIYGREFSRFELLKRVGNIAQLAEVRPSTLSDGKSSGVRIFEFETGGGLSFSLLQDKGLDFFHFKYKGHNINFYSKPGLVAPALSDLYGMGAGFLRSIAGGMMYTCGLSNNGGACTDEGIDHVFNGRVRNIPAEKLSVISRWEGDDYILGIDGDLRDTGLFCENLVMHRSVRTKLGAKSVTLQDTIENEGYSSAYVMMMYHINIGYPVLDAGTRLLLPKGCISPINEISAQAINEYNVMTDPSEFSNENAFLHRQASDKAGNSAAAAYNDKLGIGFYVRYNVHEMPNLIEWKSMAAGDYVLGLHVANCLFNRKAEREQGALQTINPFASRSYKVEFGILEGEQEASEFESELKAYALD